ncbi:MAG: aminotransferase [Christensenellaceae bacterium]|jgi:DNA-binding transcriptional MocR family regulator|nr:aminotransferase [Christensenellaceae bacterium]
MYINLSESEKKALLIKESESLENYKSKGLKLDMSRGKPCKEQLDLSMGLLDVLNSSSSLNKAQDYRNYGIIDGISELKDIFCTLLEVEQSELIICGNSSLNIMYDTLQKAMQFGILGNKPLNQQGSIKWLCPVPGYDRHFAITEAFGIEMINVPMNSDGPDMDIIEEKIKDPSVKGIWCVPKYSNPQGIVYSDSVVKRLAKLKPAQSDFRIYWDNAYMIHSIVDDDVKLLNILKEAKKFGNEDMIYIFGSTSKITFAGGGVAFIASSVKNISSLKEKMSIQTIGYDKINQYAHFLYFKKANNILEHMKKHAAIIRPKFEAVLEILKTELASTGIANWNIPQGGYFISCDLFKNTAKRTIELAKSAGVIFTPAGSTFPYMQDPNDSNVRIAPTLPPISDLPIAMKVFCTAAKIAYLEQS